MFWFNPRMYRFVWLNVCSASTALSDAHDDWCAILVCTSQFWQHLQEGTANKLICTHTHVHISPNSTWLVTSRLDTTRHVQRVEPTHFGCVQLVKQHGSIRSTRQTCRVVSRRDVTSQVAFGLYRLSPRLRNIRQESCHGMMVIILNFTSCI